MGVSQKQDLRFVYTVEPRIVCVWLKAIHVISSRWAPDAAIEKLEQDLHSVAQWCCENHLLINPDKSKVLFLSTRQMLSRLPEDPRVVFLGKTLKPTDSAKDLGVFLDPHLTYYHHISCVVSCCFAKPNVLFKCEKRKFREVASARNIASRGFTRPSGEGEFSDEGGNI